MEGGQVKAMCSLEWEGRPAAMAVRTRAVSMCISEWGFVQSTVPTEARRGRRIPWS